MDTDSTSDLERLIDYSVRDRDDADVGAVVSAWEDPAGQPAFLGIRTGWFGLGRTRVVPPTPPR